MVNKGRALPVVNGGEQTRKTRQVAGCARERGPGQTAKAEDVEKLVGGLVVPEEEEEWSAEQERKREKSGVEAGEDGEDPGAKKREVDSGVEAGEDDDLRLDARKANCVWLYVMAKTRI